MQKADLFIFSFSTDCMQTVGLIMETKSDDRYDHLLAVKDFEYAAKKFLPHCVFEYLRGGTEDEITLNARLSGWRRKARDRCAEICRVGCKMSVHGTTDALWCGRRSSTWRQKSDQYFKE